MYETIQTKSALHKLAKKRLPYDWDLNIYRGCIHRCVYCYALYSHQYLIERETRSLSKQSFNRDQVSDTSFFEKIYVKDNIAEILDKEFSAPKWKGEIVNIGGVTDSYQKCEADYKIMRDVLNVFIKHKNPLIISTKSDLILRDIDLLSELAKHTYVNVAVTITTVDDNLQKLIEPNAKPSELRFKVLKELGQTEVSTGLHMMPILPFITDSRENIEEVFRRGKEANVNYVLTGTLNLVGHTRENYLNFIKNNFNQLYPKYLELYKNWLAKKEYNASVYPMIHELKRKYGLAGNYMKPIKEKLSNKGQGRLF